MHCFSLFIPSVLKVLIKNAVDLDHWLNCCRVFRSYCLQIGTKMLYQTLSINFNQTCIKLFRFYYCYFSSLLYFFFCFHFQSLIAGIYHQLMFDFLSNYVNFGNCQWKMFIAIYSTNFTEQTKHFQLNPITGWSPCLENYTKYIPVQI